MRDTLRKEGMIMNDLEETALDRAIDEFSRGLALPIDPQALQPKYINANFISAMAYKINELTEAVNLIIKSLKEVKDKD